MHLSIRTSCGLIAFCVLWASPTGAAPVRSAPVQVVTTANCLQWNTIRQANPVLHWAWPKDARSVVVTVSTVTRFFGRPKVVSSVVDRAESDVEAWTLPMELPLQEKDVGVVSITLDFHVGGGGTGLSLPEEAVRADALGLVRGISNGSLRVLACDKSEKLWSRDEAYRGAVLSIPAGTTGVEVDGTDVELAGVPGWACAFLPARREVACALSAGSRSASASLYREGFGMALILR